MISFGADNSDCHFISLIPATISVNDEELAYGVQVGYGTVVVDVPSFFGDGHVGGL